MKKKFIRAVTAGVLTLCVAIPVASAEEKPKTEMANKDLAIGGIVMSAIGGYMLGTGLGMQNASVTCYGGFTVTCYEQGGNKALWTIGGAGVTATGLIMAAIGGKRVSVAPMVSRSVRGVSGQFRF